MTGSRPPAFLRCSLCGDPFAAGDAHKLTVRASGKVVELGAYCGLHCRDAMQAVAEIRERLFEGEVADRLLALYRTGRGPSPALVLECLQRVHTRRAGDTVTR